MNRKNFWLSTTFILGTLFAVSACSDDDNDTYVTIDDALQTTGVSSDLYGGFGSVPVKSNGKWTASIPEDCDWVTVLTPTGKGNGEVQLFFDENAAGDVRNTTLTIQSEDAETTVRLFQDDSQDGAPINDAESAALVLAAGNHYVGYGCMLFEFENNPSTSNSNNAMVRTKQAIVNSKAVSKFQESDEAYVTVIENNEYNALDKVKTSVDSIETKRDSLGISVDITITYGTFKFGLKGTYSGYENRDTKMFNYRNSKLYTCLESSANYTTAFEQYYEALEDKDNEDALTPIKKALVSSSFVKAVGKITDASDSIKKQTAVRNLINTYGSGFVYSVTIGGSLTIDLSYDSTYVKAHMGLDSAAVSVAITSGLFKLDANVTAAYVKESSDILKHGYYALDARGGDAVGLKALDRAIDSLQLATKEMSASSETKLEQLNKAGAAWAESLTPKNGALTSCSCIPIWEVVNAIDYDAGDAVYNYLQKLYPNSVYFKAALATPTQKGAARRAKK